MQQIGPYRVLDELARGGMGVVYRAVGPDGREVALKQILPERATEGRKLTRFAIEAEAQARLDHPGVVRLLASGEAPEGPWFAMELVEGETLAARLTRGPLGIAESIRVARQLAEALIYVHEQGIVHRDLKPDNVLLGEGRARLTDFGLALDAESELSRITQTGVFLGTPGYWPPEQGKGDKARIGPRSDLYGLGAVLYACLTGQPPVRGATLYACLASGMFERIAPPHLARPEVPEWLSALCLRCLSPDPRDRPASAYLVRRALLAGKDLGPRPASLRRTAGAAAVLALVGLAGLGAAVVARLGSSPEATPVAGPAAPATPEAPAPDLTPPWRELPAAATLFGEPDPELEGCLGLFEPWCFTRSPDALRLHGVSPGRPELGIPLLVGPGAWELSAEFSSLRLVTGGYLLVALHAPAQGTEEGARWLGFLLKLDASFGYRVSLLTGDPERVGDWTSLDADPRGPLSARARYEDDRLNLELRSGSRLVWRTSAPVAPAHAPSGRCSLRLGLVDLARAPRLGLANTPYYTGHLSFELTRLALAGDHLHLDPERRQTSPYREGNLGWAFAGDDERAEVRARTEALMRASVDDSATTLLPYLLMWLDLREGNLELASKRLRGIGLVTEGFTRATSWTSMRNWLRNRVLADFPHYPPEFLPFLAEVFARKLPSLDDAVDTALKRKPKTDPARFASPNHERLWAWVEISLLLAASSEPPWVPFHPLRVDYQAGRLDAARDALLALGTPTPASPQEADWRGWLYFWVGDYARCLETWPDEEADGPRRRARETARRWVGR